MYGHPYPSYSNRDMKGYSKVKICYKKGVILLFVILSLFEAKALAGHTVNGRMDDHLRSFSNGERLIFDVTWMGISAGTASLETREKLSMNGREVYHIVSTARSNKFISIIYPVDDLIETFIDIEEIYPYKISIHKKEGRRRKEKDVLFDQVKHIAIEMKEGKEIVSNVPPRVQDPLSCLYFFRTFKGLDDGKVFVIDVYDSKKNWQMEVKVIGRESITTPAGTFNTIKIKPEIYYEGLFQNKGDVYVWLTDDQRRIPVQVKSTISIGPVKATLISMVDGDKVAEPAQLSYNIIPPDPKADP